MQNYLHNSKFLLTFAPKKNKLWLRIRFLTAVSLMAKITRWTWICSTKIRGRSSSLKRRRCLYVALLKQLQRSRLFGHLLGVLRWTLVFLQNSWLASLTLLLIRKRRSFLFWLPPFLSSFSLTRVPLPIPRRRCRVLVPAPPICICSLWRR